MNDINRLYSLWREKATEKEVLDELISVEGNEKEILDRFWQNLTFGTGGLRGVIGAGTNRMNVYTVRRAAAGLGKQLISEYPDAKEKGVAIIFVGEDLDVLLELCDRILVIGSGKITGVVDARTATKEEIGLLMTKSAAHGGEAE